MPATFPGTKAEDWADSITLHPAGERDSDGRCVPSFALLETGGPDLKALALSVLFLGAMISFSIVLATYQRFVRAPHVEAVAELVAPPEPQTLPDISAPKNSSDVSAPGPESAEPVTAEPPPPELPGAETPAAPVQPVRPEPLRPTPLRAEADTPDPFAGVPIPRELMESPPPIPTQPQPVAAKTPSPAPPAAVAEVAPKVNPAPVPQEPVKVMAQNLKPASVVPAAPPGAPIVVPKHAPESLGALPLSQLIEDEAGLAAGMAALPSAQRLNLPRVSIRVNSEWFQALAQTQERLYFSITTPEEGGEVLAYVSGTQSFNLERPERPLWQIRDGESVPALASLRTAAGRWLGVSPELVGIYTWHPPMLESALRMFVLERMQELHVQLGPRDLVTVRLAAGSTGTVMNLEPIRAAD